MDVTAYARHPEIFFAELNATSSGDNTVLAGFTGKKIRITAVTFVCSSAVGVQWQSAATVKITAMPFAANGGMDTQRIWPNFFVETDAGDALVVNLSTVANVRGSLNYYLVS